MLDLVKFDRAEANQLPPPEKTPKKRKKTRPDHTQLAICAGLLVIIVSLVLLIPNLTLVQQFYLRIVIGLCAAGVAALIPGFFEIELSWLRNTIRAGGALGIFFLIYGFNPPAIDQFETLQQLEGDWEYECSSLNGPFPHGGFKHGGITHLQLNRTKYGYTISFSGDRKWVEKEEGQKEQMYPPSSWQTISGNFTGDDTIMYKYITTEQGRQYTGISCLKIIEENGKIVRLEGNFYRLNPEEQKFIYGTVIMKKKDNQSN